MKSLLDKISLKMKLIFLIIFPFFGFLSISVLYLNQILENNSNTPEKSRDLPTPAMIVIGEVVSLHEQIRWFD